MERYLYARKSISWCSYWENEGHMGIVLVSRYGCNGLSTFLQTGSVSTPDLESLAV